ncbi:MAG TPA: hypothetical protein VMV87_20885 [Burkholderiales bacterium]|nr:hypothetical protein [Burkholderiales bacterium]
MKTLLKAIGISVLLLFGTLVSGSAMADRDGHVRFGLSLGVPLYAPGYYSPYYGYPYPAYPYPAYAYPPVVVQSSPPVYIEQGAAQAAPAPADWYYCAASKSYYPYVNECPAGWQRVPAQPPR